MSSQSRIALITAAHGKKYEQMAVITNPFRRAYCKINNYDFIYCDSWQMPENHKPHWRKITLAKRYAAEYDYICWTDIDAIPLNFSIPLENYITPNKSLFVCKDVRNYHGMENYFNSGVYILKTDKYGISVLDEWLRRVIKRHVENHNPTGFKDQDDINNMVAENWHGLKQKTVIYPRESGLNSVTSGKYKKEHLMLHLAGEHGKFKDFVAHFFSKIEEKNYKPYGIAFAELAQFFEKNTKIKALPFKSVSKENS